MRKHQAVMALCVLAAAMEAGASAEARPLHRRHGYARYGHVHYSTRIRYGSILGHGIPPLSGTVGTPIPPYAARFMGYPYNVPGYRYQYADGCLLRVGGVFGPGPSISPCPFGLDRPF